MPDTAAWSVAEPGEPLAVNHEAEGFSHSAAMACDLCADWSDVVKAYWSGFGNGRIIMQRVGNG